eukprot:499036-Amphidinium_carterae.2
MKNTRSQRFAHVTQLSALRSVAGLALEDQGHKLQAKRTARARVRQENPSEPYLEWLTLSLHSNLSAFIVVSVLVTLEAHWKLVNIHPFACNTYPKCTT